MEDNDDLFFMHEKPRCNQNIEILCSNINLIVIYKICLQLYIK